MGLRHTTLFLVVALSTASVQPAAAQGVEVGAPSQLGRLVPAEALENSAGQQYEDLKRQAAAQKALAPASHPQLQRLRGIAKRILPYAAKWNDRAANWRWEVNLIASKQVNAFCMPGGKIAFFTGILDTLKLTDDEVAMVMGHEIAHALREHARERIAKTQATQVGIGVAAQLLGLGDFGRLGANLGGQLLTLKFSRDDETEADLVGMDIAARAGFDPRAGIVLWEKMAKLNKNSPPQWMSTHPSGTDRIALMKQNMGSVLPLYAATKGTKANKLPPYRSNI